MTPLTYLEVDGAGVTGAIRINDLPVVALIAEGMRAYVPVPALLVRGANSLSAQVRANAPEARLSARVALFDDGEEFFTGAGRTLARIDAPPTTGRVQVTFDCPIGPAAWAWHSCRRWASAAEALASAAPFVATLTAAFTRGDAATIVAACAPYLADLASAFPNRPAGFYAQQMMEHLSQRATLLPLRPDGSVLCADGRLLHLLAGDGNDLIRGQDQDGPFSWRALIGEIDGRWTVIR
ncbi:MULTISPECIES: hypothetical protein [Sphingomonas]|uniref:Uncharacterized protein n=1 Tax=Sphingomonas adhaesiva TaxID=28212 RepID=A0A2A4I2Z5_9SPHN|nr:MULTISPECIES: hypothetical protein [Sphingomonas]PCG13347.1 hypothetical protein COA07_14300 [Sphingomonas adhaesiva]PZU80423.1 MAG: hypothetical protein DI530_05725 [Sphingomonas sp.]